MPVMMHMEWDGVTSAQYDVVRERVKWETDVPDGAVLHVASFDDQGAHITDVWESAEAFERFVSDRLTPVTQAVGLPGEPRVAIRPAHAVFTPGV